MNLIQVSNVKGKTFSEATEILKSKGYYLRNTEVNMKRFDHKDGPYIQIQSNGRVTRSGSKVMSESGNYYNPKFDYLGNKLEGGTYDGGFYYILIENAGVIKVNC